MQTQTYLNKRLLAILSLGFASGLPIALVGSTLQAWFTAANVPILSIGFLSLVGLPYILKFLWAPLMDHYQVFGWGVRRGWILVTQVGLVLSLYLLAQLDPTKVATQMGWLALLIAFFSASQDVAIDAYRTEILQEAERGLGSAYHIFSYRIALLISGGFVFILADYIGWRWSYMGMALLLLLLMLPSYFAPQPVRIEKKSPYLTTTISAALKTLWQKEKIIWILLFIMFYKLGDALALSLMTNFLLHGLQFSLIEIGLAYKSMSIIATILGAFVGGLFLTRWSIYKALLVFGIAQALSNGMFILLALVGKSFILMASSIFIENFCSGLSTAALLTYLMSLCHTHYTATQFALLSAVASLGRVFVGPFAAMLVQQFGWVSFFSYAFLLSFPALGFLYLLKTERSYAAQVVTE